MKLMDFTRLVRSGKATLPTDPFMKGHLIWHGVDELQSEPFDIMRNSWYLQQFETANTELGRMVEQERLKVEALAQEKVKGLADQIWELIGRHFTWWNPQTEKAISLDGKLKWCGTKKITILGSGGPKEQDFGCRSDGSEVNLKPILEQWVKDYAAKLVQENREMNLVHITKDLLNAFSTVPIYCSHTNRLLHPRQACSIFTSGTAEPLHCNEVRLELRPL
jgi:hypothetical protein